MKYEKPVIEILGTALSSVKGELSKDITTPPDCQDLPRTPAAYLAEE
jgi:hypothetical protein